MTIQILWRIDKSGKSLACNSEPIRILLRKFHLLLRYHCLIGISCENADCFSALWISRGGVCRSMSFVKHGHCQGIVHSRLPWPLKILDFLSVEPVFGPLLIDCISKLRSWIPWLVWLLKTAQSSRRIVYSPKKWPMQLSKFLVVTLFASIVELLRYAAFILINLIVFGWFKVGAKAVWEGKKSTCDIIFLQSSGLWRVWSLERLELLYYLRMLTHIRHKGWSLRFVRWSIVQFLPVVILHFQKLIYLSNFGQLQLWTREFTAFLFANSGAFICGWSRPIEGCSALSIGLELGLEHFCWPLLSDTHEGGACQFVNRGSPVWNEGFLMSTPFVKLACALTLCHRPRFLGKWALEMGKYVFQYKRFLTAWGL